MLRLLSLAFGIALTVLPAHAACPSAPPNLNGKVDFEANDQRVSAAWLERTLAGKRIVYQAGTEHYQGDGSYKFSQGSESWNAPEYRFYDGGFRCIGYENPRIDIYVVNDGALIMIDRNGDRYRASRIR